MPNPTKKSGNIFKSYKKSIRKFLSVSSIPEIDEDENLENNSNSVPNLTRIDFSLTGENRSVIDYKSDNTVSEMATNNQPNPLEQLHYQPPNTISPTDIFNALRIPDAIKDLPRFDGNPRLLHEFLNNVEEILTYTRSADGSPYSRILLRAIRNKIEGQANEVLNMYGTPLVWEDIKNNLILHYSDKRTETSLIRDLHSLRQNDKTVEKFYSDIVEIQATMYNNILIHENDGNVIAAKKNLYAEMCLNTFLTGLKEPLGSIVRAMRPETIATALSYCIKEQNIFYMKSDSRSHQRPSNIRKPSYHAVHQSRPFLSTSHHAPFPRFPTFNNSQPKSSTYPQNSNNNLSRMANQTPFNNFRSNPNHNFPNSNQNFSGRQPNSVNLPRPEPMDTSSGHTYLRQRPSYQNQPNPNNLPFNNTRSRFPKYIAEELHNMNAQEHEPTYPYSPNMTNDHSHHMQLDQYYSYDNSTSNNNFEVDDSPNFPTTASKAQQDT